MSKAMIGVLIATVLIIVGLAVLQGRNSTKAGPEESTPTADVSGLVANPQSYEVGEVRINGGNVVKTFEVKNTTDSPMKLKKITTSCMCTKAKVAIGDKETREFGMEGMGDKNPPVNLELPAGGTAIVTAIFDPAAHGPKGVGAFDRVVYLTFSDPAGVKELKFNGTVVN